MGELSESAWFAGFADGEASFQIAPRNHTRLAPIFSLALRADDIAILEDLRVEFGGFLRTYVPKNHDNPAAYWHVARKKELAGLVAYFDRFPLRAKKARDYGIWRSAVLAYCAHGSHAPELQALRAALMAGRRYQADDQIIPSRDVSSQPQLWLVGCQGG